MPHRQRFSRRSSSFRAARRRRARHAEPERPPTRQDAAPRVAGAPGWDEDDVGAAAIELGLFPAPAAARLAPAPESA